MRRLAFATIVATFLLIVLGGIVRLSDSGLGCGPGGAGVEGWPLCRGDVIPGSDINAVIEYLHRAVASVVGLMWFALAYLAFKRERHLLPLTLGGAGLVVAQGLLGAFVVEEDLDELLVAAHLGLAMILLSLSMYLYRALQASSVAGSGETPAGDRPPTSAVGPAPALASAADPGPRFRLVTWLAGAALFGAIVAGGYMAGTEGYGRGEWRDAPSGTGAHFACGSEFPSCNGSFLPYGQDRLIDIHLTHRVFIYLATILLIALVVMALRRGLARQASLAIAGLLVTQLVVGGLQVWLKDEYQALILLHLTIATVLWAAWTALTMHLLPVPEPAPERRREALAV